MAFDLDEMDQHMVNLRSTLQFFSEALERTDHNSPDWLAPELISLRNQSGRLQEGMKRFRDQTVSEGLAEKKPSKRARLSLEGAKRPTPSSTPQPSSPFAKSQNSTPFEPPQPHTNAQPSNSSQEQYPAQHIDVTEEVRRRLHQGRLRRLMDSPSTSQKRKYDTYEVIGSDGGSACGTEQEDEWSGRNPAKRIRASGDFNPISSMMKRKEEGITQAFADVGKDERGSAKRMKR